MYCNKCGFKYEGNFCPMCGAIAKKTNLPDPKAVTQVEQEENPFEVFYNTEPKTGIETPFEEVIFAPSEPEQVMSAEENSEQVSIPEPPIFQQPAPETTPVQPPVYQQPAPEAAPVQQPVYPQNTPTPPQGVPMPPMNCYQPMYHQPQPPVPPQAPQRKPLGFWQILLIVFIGIVTFSVFTYVAPIGMFACTSLADPIVEPDMYYDDEEIGDEVVNKAEIGENFSDENFRYCVTKVEDIDKYGDFTPVEGYKFTAVTIEITNTEDYNSWYGYDIFMYAENEKCQEIVDERYDYSSSTILPFHSYTRTYVFEVPVDPKKTELFISDFNDELTKIEIE